jgi:hypothetical protein
MHEDKTELADERRKQAIAEIMERGRILEEKRRGKRTSQEKSSQTPSFDELVDNSGHLLPNITAQCDNPAAMSSAIETTEDRNVMRQRTCATEVTPSTEQVPSAASSAIISSSTQQSQNDPEPTASNNPFESRYEQEMREAWSMPLPDQGVSNISSHPSESLLELTPTTEDAPDPDFSVPSTEYLDGPLERSNYFSAATSNSAISGLQQSLHPSEADSSVSRVSAAAFHEPSDYLVQSSTPSVVESVSEIRASEADDSDDGLLSEIGDGIRTPSTAWSEIDSTVSEDF